MPFELFDRKQDFSIRQANLPHWYQPGVTYFVTFRTADSVPDALAAQWRRAKANWLRMHGIDADSDDWKTALVQLPAEIEQEFHQEFTEEFDRYLDRGFGSCLLRRSDLASIVGESLRSFDGTRYHLGDFVVMPNHVHLLCCLIGDANMEARCESWKHFTARTINAMTSRSGRFWQSESFDHLVRSPEQFDRFRRYIADNPKKARLKSGEFLYYCRDQK